MCCSIIIKCLDWLRIAINSQTGQLGKKAALRFLYRTLSCLENVCFKSVATKVQPALKPIILNNIRTPFSSFSLRIFNPYHFGLAVSIEELGQIFTVNTVPKRLRSYFDD